MPSDKRITDRQGCVRPADPLDEFVVHRAVHDQSTQGGATLTRGPGGGEHDAAQRQIEVGRRPDDRGVVAAQLEDRPTEAAGDDGRDLATHGGRTGCGDDRDTLVHHQGPTDIGSAEHDLHQTVRSPGLGDRLLQQTVARQRRERCLVARLPDHRIAGDEGERGVPRPHRDREVEGADHADRTHRVPGLHQAVTGPLGRDRQPVELP